MNVCIYTETICTLVSSIGLIRRVTTEAFQIRNLSREERLLRGFDVLILSKKVKVAQLPISLVTSPSLIAGNEDVLETDSR